ncbi:MAG TPA: YggS family pyridoxal phosphate-dependent enzyme [Spirochaetaceae bacterium]|nr:YggS family pyridoxal phosphate-dependent enzyme [Spirochaetaceae bacterium]
MSVDIRDSLEKLEGRICAACSEFGRRRSDIVLCAVSKTHPLVDIESAVENGASCIGENYVSEILGKIPLSHPAYKVRMIGHLQTNKVRKVIPYVDSIDSVDSLHLLTKVCDAAASVGKRIEVLFEINSSMDANKTGFRDLDELRRSLDFIMGSDAVFFNGFMTMGPVGGEEARIRAAFDFFNETIGRIENEYPDLPVGIRSFGMTDDFRIAIEKGSNMLRIGRAIFGERS